MQTVETQTVPIAQYQELQQKYDLLVHELAQLKRLIFGRKSERFTLAGSEPGQLQLDFGLEAAPQREEEKKTTVAACERSKKKPVKINLHGRGPLPASLPRQDIIIEPEEDTSGMKYIGDEVTEELEYKPAGFFVRRFLRRKYVPVEAVAQGSDADTPCRIVMGKLPARPIEKGIPGPALLAYIIISKMVDHLPLYRLMKMFWRQGIKISDSTLGGWFKAACALLLPLYEAQKRLVQECSYLQVDETPIKVLESEQKGKSHRGYMWVYHAPVEKMPLFDYRSGRSRAGPTELLAGFRGVLQSDGYSVYELFGHRRDITTSGCLAHARRKFLEARDSDQERADQVLTQIQVLYAIERKAREEDLNQEARLSLRQEKARPVFDTLEQYLKDALPEVLPKSPIGHAIAYCLSRWKKLEQYLLDGKLEIDNNLVENTIRPIALGRKNYLFAGNHEAAQRLAMLYTFMASCKANNVNPQEWLRDILIRLPNHPINRIEQLLPHRWKPLKQYPWWLRQEE